MQVTSLEQFEAAKQTLVMTRGNLVKGAKVTGDLISNYAEALCTMFHQVNEHGEVLTPWYELKGKTKAGVKEERAAFAADMSSAGFGTGTTDVYWQRVKEASGYITPKNRVSGSTGVDAKNLSDLQTIINRIFKAEEAGDSSAERSSEYKGQLMEIFEGLGGDPDKLG